MKLILLLFLNLCYKFAVFGDGPQNANMIDTKELDDNDQNLLKSINDTTFRRLMKETLWEKKMLREEKEDQIRNNFFIYIICGFTHVKVELELFYPEVKRALVDPMYAQDYNELELLNHMPKDVYELLKLDEQWIPRFNKDFFSKHDEQKLIEDIKNYKEKWINYLRSKEGRNLALLIAPGNLDNDKRIIIFVRFAYCMARLFKISYAFHHRLLKTLSDKSRAEPKNDFLTIMKDVIPSWSCTEEQIKFYNILAKYINSHAAHLDILVFDDVKMGTSNITLVVPYTKDKCGFLNDTARTRSPN